MQVSVQELKSHLSQYLHKVQMGDEIEITSHRKVIARLRGAKQSALTGIEGLLATQTASWSGGKPKGANLISTEPSKSMSDLILEMRG